MHCLNRYPEGYAAGIGVIAGTVFCDINNFFFLSSIPFDRSTISIKIMHEKFILKA